MNMNKNMNKNMKVNTNQQQKESRGSTLDNYGEKKSTRAKLIEKPEGASMPCGQEMGEKEKRVQQEGMETGKRKRTLRTDETDVSEPNVKRARVGSKGVEANRVQPLVPGKPASSKSLNLPLPSSKSAPPKIDRREVSSGVVKDKSKKRGCMELDERELKRIKTREEAVRNMTETNSHWETFLEYGDKLGTKIHSLEGGLGTFCSSIQIRTAVEAKEVRDHHGSIRRVYRVSVGWMDDLVVQMRMLERKRSGARSEKEKRRVNESILRKREEVQETVEKVCAIVRKMGDWMKIMRNRLREWEKRESE